MARLLWRGFLAECMGSVFAQHHAKLAKSHCQQLQLRQAPRAGRSVSRNLIQYRGIPMKVVLFCGGMGMRMREYSESIPKPMVPIGYRPILWHVMRYYAHYDHKDFVLCLGYKADVIKNYFRNY